MNSSRTAELPWGCHMYGTARTAVLNGLMLCLKQVEAHDTEVCDVAELGLWNGTKPGVQKAPTRGTNHGVQKAPTTGKSAPAAKGSIHMGVISGTKAGPTPSKPEVGDSCLQVEMLLTQ